SAALARAKHRAELLGHLEEADAGARALRLEGARPAHHASELELPAAHGDAAADGGARPPYLHAPDADAAAAALARHPPIPLPARGPPPSPAAGRGPAPAARSPSGQLAPRLRQPQSGAGLPIGR